MVPTGGDNELSIGGNVAVVDGASVANQVADVRRGRLATSN